MLFNSLSIPVLILFATSGFTSLTFADEELPVPAGNQASEKAFPLQVRYYGFVKSSASVPTAIVEIEGQSLILKQGVAKLVAFDGAPFVTQIEFREIDFDNRQIRLGFPKSEYTTKIYSMK